MARTGLEARERGREGAKRRERGREGTDGGAGERGAGSLAGGTKGNTGEHLWACLVGASARDEARSEGKARKLMNSWLDPAPPAPARRLLLVLDSPVHSP